MLLHRLAWLPGPPSMLLPGQPKRRLAARFMAGSLNSWRFHKGARHGRCPDEARREAESYIRSASREGEFTCDD